MPKRHIMVVETKTDTEALFFCPECDRKVVFNAQHASVTVINTGDPAALHQGSTLSDLVIEGHLE